MKKLLVILSVLLFFSCTKKTEQIPLSFYYWKTNFQLTETEEEYLTDLEVNKLYIRYFDVGLKDSIAIPVAPVIFNQKVEKYKVVPVVYIKNEVFLHQNAADSLPQKVFDYIRQINQSANVSVNEIQFDCDWSLQSKDNYFAFIDEFKKLHPNLSATIRLHQVKYPEKTGIPDVHKGVLMYYNMGVISSGENNSIYDRSVAKRYIGSLSSYQLPLDIALPVFSWGVQSRNHQVINLIGGLRTKDLQKHPFKKISKHQYQLQEDFIYEGRYLAKGDLIKIEEPTIADIKEMVTDLSKHVKTKPNEIIFYDLNEQNLQPYEKEDFKIFSLW